MIAPKEILVATDFGPASSAALRYAREFARAFGGRVHVLHVIGDIIATDVTPTGYGQAIDKAQSAMEAGAREELRAFVESDRPDDSIAELESIVASNSTASAILEYAEEHFINLVIIGTHGASGLAHLLLGSVAEKVVRSAPCPVLTVRQPEREFVQPAIAEHQLQA